MQTIVRHLQLIQDGGPSVYVQLLPLLVEFLGMEKAIAYGVERHEEAHRLTLAESAGIAHGVVRREMGAVVGKSCRGWGFFHPLRPEVAQRNRAFALKVNEWVMEPDPNLRSAAPCVSLTPATHPELFQAFRGLGVIGSSQLRVLVCEEDALLAWVGGFRAEPFGERECRLLQLVTPALQRRLGLEQLLQQGAWLRRGLAAAMEEVSSPAFIVDQCGYVKHTNAVGQTQLDRHPSATRMDLAQAIAHPAPGQFRKTPLGCGSQRPHWLLVSNGDGCLEGRLTGAVRRWALTARQGEVLGALIQGQANKTIAIQLDCAVRTIEQHVTGILQKAGVDTRAALAAKFWKSP